MKLSDELLELAEQIEDDLTPERLPVVKRHRWEHDDTDFSANCVMNPYLRPLNFHDEDER